MLEKKNKPDVCRRCSSCTATTNGIWRKRKGGGGEGEERGRVAGRERGGGPALQETRKKVERDLFFFLERGLTNFFKERAQASSS